MHKARTLKVNESKSFGQQLLTSMAMLIVLVTTVANLAFTFAPEAMTRLVQSLFV